MPNPTPQISIEAHHETWPLREAFKISRGSKTSAEVIVVTVTDGQHIGRGEAVPYVRYGETIDAARASIAALEPLADRQALHLALPPGAARNAVDCAMWDLEAKRHGRTAHAMAGVSHLDPVLTAYTLSLDTPDVMAAKAASVSNLHLLKLKLGGAGDRERMAAVRRARPDARLIADANEAWSVDELLGLMRAAAEFGFETIEQPLPEHADEALRGTQWPVPICADESCRTSADLQRLCGLYDAINIKLDKTGGLTDALELHRLARARGMKIMIGSMVATSLAVAPAMLLAQDAEWVDLDGPLLLAHDRQPGLVITNGLIAPPSPDLWG